MNDYLSGWRKWSGRIFGVELPSEIDPTNPRRMLILGGAMFSHESNFATPLTSAQIVEGIQQRQDGIRTLLGDISPLAERPASTPRLNSPALDTIKDAAKGDTGFTVRQDFEMEFHNSQQRLRTVLEILKRQEQGEDVRGALEK
jgi:hypothetical protein